MRRLSLLLTALLCGRVSCVLAEPSIAIEPDQGNVWSGSEVRVQLTLDGFKERRARVQWHLAADDTVITGGETRVRLRRGRGRDALVIQAPEVKRRVSMSVLVTVAQGDDRVGPAVTTVTVFPRPTKDGFQEGLLGLDLHVYDPSNSLVALLQQLEIPFKPTRPSDLVDTPPGAVVLVGSGALRRGLLPPNKMLRFAREGRTFLVFRQDSLGNASEWEGAAIELLDEPVPAPAASWGPPPPRWASDIDDGVLRRWAGGSVGTALCFRPLTGNSITWLMKPDDGLPLLMELWPGNGRVILCQCPIVEQFDAEPVTHLLLKDLLRYASSPDMSSFKGAIRLAYHAEQEPSRWGSIGLYPEVLDTAALLDAGEPTGSALLLLIGVKAEMIGHLQRQHLSPQEIRRRVFNAGATLLVVSAVAEDAPLIEELVGRPVAFSKGINGPVRINDEQRGRLTRGLTANVVASTLDAEQVDTVPVIESGAGAVELVGPGLIVKYTLDHGSVIVCQIPLDEENSNQQRFHAQFLTNVGVRLLRRENQ